MTSGQQYLRKASLIVQIDSVLIDLSQLRFKFATRQSDVETPNSCSIRIYNLSDETRNKISGKGANTEFKQITLSAGYENAQFGLVFQGTIKQTRRGRESAVDTYLDILASDGDITFNFAVVSKTLAAGGSSQDALNALFESAQSVDPNFTVGSVDGLVGGTLPRGKVMFGMFRDYARDIATSNQTFWSIQNGKFQMIKRTAYLPGTVVILNSNSGLISQPEQTEEGIRIKSLLNPSIVIGSLVKINNGDINQTINQTTAPISYDSFVNLQLLADVTADGNYRAYVVEHHGDTRGQDWYTNITGLAVDVSSPVNNAVPAGAL